MSAIGAINLLSISAASPIQGRRGVEAAAPTAGADAVAHGPAVVLGGRLASVSPVSGPDAIGQTPGVAPVPPVKPVVYRPGAAVNLSI